MPRLTPAVALAPHPATPCPAVQSIRVDVRRKPLTLSLRYVLAGELRRLRVPAPRGPARTDGLWRHTCFELFVAAPGGPGYDEFNFSPSGEWAAYRFAAYRQGQAPLDCGPLEVRTRREPVLEVQAEVSCPAGVLRIGLSAVVEDDTGALAYWALGHPAAKPDFHDAGSFVLELDEIRH